MEGSISYVLYMFVQINKCSNLNSWFVFQCFVAPSFMGLLGDGWPEKFQNAWYAHHKSRKTSALGRATSTKVLPIGMGRLPYNFNIAGTIFLNYGFREFLGGFRSFWHEKLTALLQLGLRRWRYFCCPSGTGYKKPKSSWTCAVFTVNGSCFLQSRSTSYVSHIESGLYRSSLYLR